MLVRLIATGALAWGLIATGAVALADSAEAKLFQGRTAQGHRIKFLVKKNTFKIQRFKADLRCSDGGGLLLDEGGFLWTRVSGGGNFRDAQFGKTDSVYFRGRLSEGRIRGKVRLTDKLKRGVRCRSKWIRFNATPR